MSNNDTNEQTDKNTSDRDDDEKGWGGTIS